MQALCRLCRKYGSASLAAVFNLPFMPALMSMQEAPSSPAARWARRVCSCGPCYSAADALPGLHVLSCGHMMHSGCMQQLRYERGDAAGQTLVCL